MFEGNLSRSGYDKFCITFGRVIGHVPRYDLQAVQALFQAG